MSPEDESLEISELREEICVLREQLLEAQNDAVIAKREATRAFSNLRRQLNPLYQALQMVYGELDAVSEDESPTTSTAAWDEWKRRLGPACAKVIDALLLGGEMSVKGITVSAKMGLQTVYQATSKMGQAGILVRNGSKFSLKKI